MKHSELRKIIKEEIQKLDEVKFSKKEQLLIKIKKLIWSISCKSKKEETQRNKAIKAIDAIYTLNKQSTATH